MQNELLSLLLLSAAVWRISYMLVWEDGPYYIFNSVREFVGVRYDIDLNRKIDSNPMLPKWRNSLAELFNCVYCMSVWVSILVYIVYLFKPFLAVALAVPFALSTGAIAINRWCDYGES